MSPMSMDQQTCFQRAQAALLQAGLTDLKVQDGWTTSAVNNTLRAGISCVNCENGVLVDIAVAGANGSARTAARMRDQLRDAMQSGGIAGQLDSPPVLAGACTVTGSYRTDYKTLHLVQDGNKVTGYYEYDNGKVTGTLKGRTLTGTWTQTKQSGQFIFDFAPDCQSFDGRYEQKGRWHEDWNGTRIDFSVDGKWKTNYKVLTLVQVGNEVSGTYPYMEGRIQGMLDGRILKGTWYQSNGSGSFVFEFAPDGRSFDGRYEQKGRWHEDWDGTKQ